MGVALELIAGRVVAPGTTLTPITINTGNSLTIRNAPFDSDVFILQAWATNQSAGILRIRSPKLHDNVQGLRLRTVAARAFPLLPLGTPQKTFPQEALTVELSGSATAGDIEMAALLLYYSNLPGVDARLHSIDDIAPRVKHIFPVETSITPGTSGDYSGEKTIVADFDLFKANTDYALLGYRVTARANLVRYRGADTGNLGIGGPAEPELAWLTERFFVTLSETYNIPAIPVFNSANKGAILVDTQQDENATALVVTSYFAELE